MARTAQKLVGSKASGRLWLEALALLATAFVARFVWSRILPLDGGNDEIFHLYTARLLAVAGWLASPESESFYHPAYRFLELTYTGHPRGAYLIGTALYGLGDVGPDAYLRMRLGPVILGSLAVVLGYAALRVHWPRPSSMPVATASLMALSPQCVFATSYFNADGFGIFAAAMTYLAAALLLKPGREWQGALAGASGLALIALSDRPFWPAALAVPAALLLRWGAGGGRLTAIVILLVLASSVPGTRAQRVLPPLRIQGVPGSPPARGSTGGGLGLVSPPQPHAPPARLLPGFQLRNLSPGARAKHPSLYRFGLGYLTASTFMSFWGVFGYMGVLMPPTYYIAWLVYCAAALGGLVVGLRRVRTEAGALHPKLPLLFAYVVPALVILLGHVYVNLYDPNTAYQPQGRYLFGALLPLLAFLVLGLNQLCRATRLQRWIAPGCVGWALIANLWALGVIARAPWPQLVWAP